MRVSTSLCVVEREASRLQCSVARIWIAQGGVDRARRSARRTASAAAEAVIVPCGHHAPGAHRRHSIHAEGWSDAHPAPRRRRSPSRRSSWASRRARPTTAPETPDTAGTDTPAACAPSGPISEAVEVSGDFDTEPDRRRSRRRCRSTATQRTVVIEGDGTEVQDGALAQVHFTLFNGETGERLDSTGYDPATLLQATVDEARCLPGLVQDPPLRRPSARASSASCRPSDGIRRHRATPTSASGPASPSSSCSTSSSVVPTQAEGDSSPLPDGFPEVTWADDGQPTVTIPDVRRPRPSCRWDGARGERVGDVVGARRHRRPSTTRARAGTPKRSLRPELGERGRSSLAVTEGSFSPASALRWSARRSARTILVVIPQEYAYGTRFDPARSTSWAAQTLVFLIDIKATAAALFGRAPVG